MLSPEYRGCLQGALYAAVRWLRDISGQLLISDTVSFNA